MKPYLCVGIVQGKNESIIKTYSNFIDAIYVEHHWIILMKLFSHGFDALANVDTYRSSSRVYRIYIEELGIGFRTKTHYNELFH